jgi:hypothetical protein
MLTERRQIVGGGRRSYAGSIIAYDHDIAFAVDRQIKRRAAVALSWTASMPGSVRTNLITASGVARRRQ